jgi:hypothetical protein
MNKDINHLEKWNWLLGLIDAEGNFNINKEKRINKKNQSYYKLSYTFRISMSIRDKELIYDIKNFLQMGTVYLYKNREEAHFVIYQVNEVKQFVSMLSEYNLLTRNQSDNFLLFKWGLFRNIKKATSLEQIDILFQRPIYVHNYKESTEYISYKNIFIHKIDSINPKFSFNKNWISGFITGEGSFTTNARNKSFNFNLEQAEKEVLDYIKAFLQFNPKIYTKKKRENRKQTYCIEFSAKKDLSNLINFIQNKEKNSSFISIQGYKKAQFYSWLESFNNKQCKKKLKNL